MISLMSRTAGILMLMVLGSEPSRVVASSAAAETRRLRKRRSAFGAAALAEPPARPRPATSRVVYDPERDGSEKQTAISQKE